MSRHEEEEGGGALCGQDGDGGGGQGCGSVDRLRRVPVVPQQQVEVNDEASVEISIDEESNKR